MAEPGRWERFWFGEACVVRLAAFRMVMMAAAFYSVWHFRIGVFQHADGIDAAFLARHWNPIYAFDLLGIGPPGDVAARVVFGALLVALVCGTIGLYTRTACAVVALLVFYWIGAHYSFGKPHHDCIALMFGLVALPLAPVGARLSVDSLRRRLRAARDGGDPRAVPHELPWAALPWRVTQLTVALGYFFAGATKLVLAGPGWANGYTLQGIMLEYPSPWTDFFARHVGLCMAMSIGLLVVQTTFPLVFLHRRLRWVYVPLAVVFHLLAMQTMGTGTFISLWFTLAAFVALERVPGFLGRRLRGGALLSRAAWGLLLASAAVLVVRLYTRQMPAWFLLALAPLVLTGLQALRRSSPLQVAFDAGSAAARRSVALLDALDWAGGLSFEARAGLAGGLAARDARGRRYAGNEARAEAWARAPLTLLARPWRLLRGGR